MDGARGHRGTGAQGAQGAQGHEGVGKRVRAHPATGAAPASDHRGTLAFPESPKPCNQTQSFEWLHRQDVQQTGSQGGQGGQGGQGKQPGNRPERQQARRPGRLPASRAAAESNHWLPDVVRTNCVLRKCLKYHTRCRIGLNHIMHATATNTFLQQAPLPYVELP